MVTDAAQNTLTLVLIGMKVCEGSALDSHKLVKM